MLEYKIMIVRIATYSLQMLYPEITTKSAFIYPQTPTKRTNTLVHLCAILGLVFELLALNAKNEAIQTLGRSHILFWLKGQYT